MLNLFKRENLFAVKYGHIEFVPISSTRTTPANLVRKTELFYVVDTRPDRPKRGKVYHQVDSTRIDGVDMVCLTDHIEQFWIAKNIVK